MPFLVLILVAVTAGALAGLLAWRYPRPAKAPAAPALDAAEKVGQTVRRHPRLRATLDRRLNPESATGLALTLALGLTIGAGILLGLLAYLVRTNSSLIGIDNSVGKWGNRHASALSTDGLNAFTQLGSFYVIVTLCVILAVAETWRTHSRWIVPFIIAVFAGEELITNVIKQIVDRVRPSFNPAAATLGPSFPSGHSATAAAFYACAALLLGRQRPPLARALVAGAAVGIAVGVASSRVLLDVHWLTDVIGGLAVGWAWFAICGIAFGGRILSFGAGVEVAARVAQPGGQASPSEAPETHTRAVAPSPLRRGS